MGKIFSRWIPLAITISCLCGLLYVLLQQNLRQNANDPQIQMAEDLALGLDNHQDVIINNRKVDLSQSMSPFVMVFNQQGTITSSEAVLHGNIPTVPKGVFDYVLANGQDRFTWQPENGVRIAAVVTKYANGYVLAGRSLREVENREDQLLKLVLLGWAGTLVASFLGAIVFFNKK